MAYRPEPVQLLPAVSQFEAWRWIFRAQLVRVTDGDTYRLHVDLGFHVRAEHAFRLRGVDCPELDTAGGKAAREFAESWFLDHWHAQEWPIRIVTDKDRMTFNRYVANVSCAEGHDLGEAIVAAGHGSSRG